MDRYYVDAQADYEIPKSDAPGEANPRLRHVSDIASYRVTDRDRNRVVAVCPEITQAYRIAELFNEYGGLP